MNMKKFNNHGLDAINSRVCMALALDDFDDDEEPVPNIKSKQVQNRDYTKEYSDYSRYLKNVYNIGGLTENEQNDVIFRLPAYFEKVAEPIPAEVIANFCKAIDRNKRLPGLYETINSKVIEKLSIRFVTEEKMPKADIPIWYPIEYLGYYDSEACQIILCPERIKKAPRRLKNRKINNPPTSQEIYGMVFIHALSHALLDMISKIDTQESQFMDESIATMMTLFYYLQTKPNSNQYKTLLEWFQKQSNACMAGLEQFKMFENDKGLMKKYWAVWMERKSKLLCQMVKK